ncbi:MAG: potassium transporter TrkG [Pseudomonadota bacterium]
MNHLAIIRVFSMLTTALAACLALGAFVAWIVGDRLQLGVFLVTSIILMVMAGTVLFLTDASERRTSPNDGLAIAVLIWIVLPLPAGIPFFSFMDEPRVLTAYYEAVSCLTTTGQSLITDAENPLPTSLLVWRAVLHLLGAIAAITIAASILSALNLGGPGIHRSYLFTIREGDFFDSLPKVVRATTVLVISSTLILSSLLLMLGASPRAAFSWSISAITTGLVDPTSTTYNPAMNPIQSALIFVGLVFGTVGFVVTDHIVSRKWARAVSDPETVALVFALGAVGILVFLAGVPIFQAMGWSLSSLATSGMALSDSSRFQRIPLPLEILPVLIGGSALSAAGGIKLARLIVLSRRVGLEFIQLGYRGSVQKFRFRGQYQSEETVAGVWVYLVGYIIAAVTGVLLLSVLGLPFEAAIRTAIGSLSNSGHIIDGGVVDAGPLLQICAILGMLLGRLEVIALLPTLNPSFWRA